MNKHIELALFVGGLAYVLVYVICGIGALVEWIRDKRIEDVAK